MLMSRVVAALVAMALVFGGLSGRMTEVSNGLVEGAAGAVSLMISIGGAICLWSGLMEVMARSGLAEWVARLLRPLILLLFGKAGRDREARDAISQNMAANLLGLGSAATPSGLRAARRLQQLAEQEGRPPDEVMLLIVLNTASLQLIPTTIAAVRAGLGAVEPYDILPAVWLASGISVAVGILACKLMQRGWRQP
jgi:spore maturation protein A